MCGIIGFIDPALTDSDEAAFVLARMRAAIWHRGPDDEGEIADGGVGFGLQRLSIVDLASGHQPMSGSIKMRPARAEMGPQNPRG